MAVVIGNSHKHVARLTVDCHLSAKRLADELQDIGWRVELLTDLPGGQLLERLKLALNKARATDNGFILVCLGHGSATYFLGNDEVQTMYQDIVAVIAAEGKLEGQDTLKLVVADACQGGHGCPAQFSLPPGMIFAHSTDLTARAFEKPGVGSVFSTHLADAIRSYSSSWTVEQVLKHANAKTAEEMGTVGIVCTPNYHSNVKADWFLS